MAAATKAASSQFVADLDGRTVVVLEGARFPAQHPVVKAHPHRFATIKRPATRKGAPA